MIRRPFIIACLSRFVLVVGLAWFGFGSQAVAQDSASTVSAEPGPLDLSLKLQSHTIEGEKLKIGYSIPFDGMVEVKITKGVDSQMVWRTQYIRRTGEHEIKLNTRPLPVGEYHYTLTYKGNDYRSNFAVSGEGRPEPEEDEVAGGGAAGEEESVEQDVVEEEELEDFESWLEDF